MPGKIKVKVLAGRNLPIMDRASDTTDAFVEIKFGCVTHKTDVCRKSLNPHWNSTEWYRFEDEPLQLRVMDHDTYSANDAIGKVVISLAPLLARDKTSTNGSAGPPGVAVMSGWIPVFDTLHGIRGELNVVVKVELFSDFNKYKTSSCGVQFFHCEFSIISASVQVQRLVGLKAAELGANAVLGYQQEFDLEGEAGVVARAIVTDDDSVEDLKEYYQHHQDELQMIVNILNPRTPSLLDEQENVDDDDKSLEIQRSNQCYPANQSIYQGLPYQRGLKHISEDQLELNKLLNRPDCDSSDSSGTIQKIIKIKTNFFSKRFARRKSSKQDDQISIKSSSSDTSRISEIKNEFKKLRRIKVPKIRKLDVNDVGINMASILARSVIHAHTSLARISESLDSEHSPGSTLCRPSDTERTTSPRDDKYGSDSRLKDDKHDPIKLPEIQCTSMENLAKEESGEPERKISESCPTSPVILRNDNLLKLPREVSYYGSVSSAISAESSDMYTTSDEDDDSYEIRPLTERIAETTSSVVKTVLSHDIDPDFIAQMEKKLTVLEQAALEQNANRQPSPKIESETAKKDFISQDDKTCVNSKFNSHFRITNPFSHKNLSSSFSAPSSPVEKKSFVYRSSKHIKRQLSKISKSSMIKSLSHYSLLPHKKRNDPKPSLSQPASSSDVTSKAPSDTVLGTPFLSYTDLLILDKDEKDLNLSCRSEEIYSSPVSMYIGSEPCSRTSLSGPSHSREDSHCFNEQRSFKKPRPDLKPTGLIATAMETILIDKVQSLLIPTSPDVETKTADRKFFNDVSHKLKSVDDQYKQASNVDIIKKDAHARLGKKLTRQDSIRSNESIKSLKMSKDVSSNVTTSCKLTHTPVLQNFHPILSGAPLETIPSLPESSVDKSESLDVDGVESECETNTASVCGNSHAACDVDRNERDRDKCEIEKYERDKDRGSPRHARHESCGGRDQLISVATVIYELNKFKQNLVLTNLLKRVSDASCTALKTFLPQACYAAMTRAIRSS
ncbi:unnamed protein product [Leptidea sinapis]|uniref:C2 domain-containing protein n=1 Tax=Leptidea sinapis TaxID=189913 RepID=A0A5E4Q7Y9_9NEOP|nr:unnamed protein product [Leptidea sinapis]